jgi:hypothetical protein
MQPSRVFSSFIGVSSRDISLVPIRKRPATHSECSLGVGTTSGDLAASGEP